MLQFQHSTLPPPLLHIVDGSLAFETSWKKSICCLRFEWKALSSWRGRRKLPFDSISSRQPSLALARCDDELELISFFFHPFVYLHWKQTQRVELSSVCHWSCREHQISISVWWVKVNFRTFPRVGALKWAESQHFDVETRLSLVASFFTRVFESLVDCLRREQTHQSTSDEPEFRDKMGKVNFRLNFCPIYFSLSPAANEPELILSRVLFLQNRILKLCEDLIRVFSFSAGTSHLNFKTISPGFQRFRVRISIRIVNAKFAQKQRNESV